MGDSPRSVGKQHARWQNVPIMSRTDKTKPWSVRAIEASPTEVHDHRDGTCDLPPLTKESFGWKQHSHCYWIESTRFYHGRDGGCGCPSCNDQQGRRIARRKERHNARAQARRTLREVVLEKG